MMNLCGIIFSVVCMGCMEYPCMIMDITSAVLIVDLVHAITVG